MLARRRDLLEDLPKLDFLELRRVSPRCGGVEEAPDNRRKLVWVCQFSRSAIRRLVANLLSTLEEEDPPRGFPEKPFPHPMAQNLFAPNPQNADQLPPDALRSDNESRATGSIAHH